MKCMVHLIPRWSHLKDSSYVRTYGDKENVWLFYQNSISEWSSFEYDGETLWEPYMCDCYRNYVIDLFFLRFVSYLRSACAMKMRNFR